MNSAKNPSQLEQRARFDLQKLSKTKNEPLILNNEIRGSIDIRG
ncbi:hypothetical protein F3D3_0994 [Fusibacter sp. 3D3]|nr:hypothetical protein F3D3_0994 [Fusibacter sp. 3D3]